MPEIVKLTCMNLRDEDPHGPDIIQLRLIFIV